MLKIFKAILRNAPKEDTTTVAADTLFKACRDILHVNGSNLHPPVSFKLAVGQSKLPNAGYGVLVADGRVRKGDVVCLYSGKSKLQRTLTNQILLILFFPPFRQVLSSTSGLVFGKCRWRTCFKTVSY